MNHTVLARKWRPKKFADLIGQGNTTTILQNIIRSQRLHHAYLLTGTRGVGKTTIARIIAKALNCLNLIEQEPCCQCSNCLQIDSGRMVDVIEIDAASNTGVDNIREVLENAQYAPTSGKYKIYIIDEVHMLSKSAFNAMLKTLEEPPEHVIFILATTDPQKVPITILSRCLQLKLRNLAAPEIQNYLAKVLELETINFELTALEIIADAANGSMRDALSLTDQAIAFANGIITQEMVQNMLGISDDGSIIEILNALHLSNSPQLISICQRMHSEGRNLENILEQINRLLFQIALAQLSPQPQLSPEIKKFAQLISLQDCQLYFEISNLGLEQIAKINNKYPIFVMTLLRMLAFTIGSQEQKQIIIQANNVTTQLSIENSPLLVDNLAKPSLEALKKTPIISSEPNILHQETIKEISPKLLLNEGQQPVAPVEAAINNNIDYPPWQDNPKEVTSPETNLVAPQPINNQPINNQPIKLTIQQSEIIIPEQPEIKKSFFDGNWTTLVKSIDLTNLDPNVGVALRNSQLDKFSNNIIELSILDTFEDALTTECTTLIENIIRERYYESYQVKFNLTKSTIANSLKSQELNEMAILQQQAEESIKNDPIIQDLVSNFSAKILPNSIKPL